MTQAIIDIGDAPNDGTGDPVRDAFNKCNNNFTELYTTGSGAPLNSPAFTGNPTAPTPTPGDNDTSLATTAFVTAAVAAGSSAGGAGPPQGRLTLATATPVMTTAQSAKTTIYYTPYVGNKVPLYDGTSMVMTTFAELSVATTDATKNPAAVGASQVLDWFIWSDAGTLRLSHGPAWTSDTVRSAGTALVMVSGILLNNAAITNACAAQRGTYVGTTRSNASNTLDWIIGGTGPGGVAAFFSVWNTYNRVNIAGMVRDNADSWTTASTSFIALNASNNNRISMVNGLDDDTLLLTLTATVLNSASGGGVLAIGQDSATGGAVGAWGYAPAVNLAALGTCVFMGIPGVGFHFFQALQASSGGTVTYYGDNGGSYLQEGFGISMRA